MNTKILSKDKDPMGAAILDYQKSGRAGRLRVLSSMFEEDEMPVKHLFRKVEEMPILEQKALATHKRTCTGYRSRQRLPYARLAGEGLGGKSH